MVKTTFQRGFSIIELIAVITIVGILAAVAGPKFIGNDVFETRGAQATLMSALRYAQKTAVAQRRVVYVVVNTAARSVCLGYTNTCSQAVIDPSTQVAYSKVLPSTVSISASASVLGFDALGQPVPNASATFTVQNTVDASQGPRTVTIEADTGYVR
jgi:MSHA pilin protein MshC